MIEISAFRVYGPVTGTSLNLTFLNKLLIDRWCSISMSDNHISDHGLKYLSGALISTDNLECFKFPLRLCD